MGNMRATTNKESGGVVSETCIACGQRIDPSGSAACGVAVGRTSRFYTRKEKAQGRGINAEYNIRLGLGALGWSEARIRTLLTAISTEFGRRGAV
jgi:hypothetical protein